MISLKIKFAIAASSLALLLSGCFGGESDKEKEAGTVSPGKENTTEQAPVEESDVEVDKEEDATTEVDKETEAKEGDRYNYSRHGSAIDVKDRVAIKEEQAEFQKNESVEAVEVFEQNGTVFAEMNVKKDATEKKVKELTTTTVEKLKKKHPKKPITVTVVKDEEKVSDTSVDVDKKKAAKTVGSVNGLSVLDPILQTYIIRIEAAEVPDAKPEDALVMTVNGVEYVMEYDKERDLYQNSVVEADDVEQVKNATFIIKSK